MFSSYVEVVVFVLKSSCVNITLSCVSVAFDDTSSALATLIDSSAIINIIKNKKLIFKHLFSISPLELNFNSIFILRNIHYFYFFFYTI